MLLRFFFFFLIFILNFLLIVSINIETNYASTISNSFGALKVCRDEQHAAAETDWHNQGRHWKELENAVGYFAGEIAIFGDRQ